MSRARQAARPSLQCIQEANRWLCEVLFCGDVHAPRRRIVLSELGKRFHTLLVDEALDANRHHLLARAKVVVHLHERPDSPLDMAYLKACLDAGATVVSEAPRVGVACAAWLSRVHFVDVGDLDGMLKELERLLKLDAALPDAQADVERSLSARAWLH